MQTLAVRPGRVQTLLIAGVAALFVLALLAPALVQAQAANPAQPTGLGLTPKDKALDVAWSFTAADPPAIRSFELRYRRTQPTNIYRWQTQRVDSHARKRTITGLENGRVYEVQIRAVGTGTAASEWTDSQTETPAGPPGMPGTPTGSLTADTELTFEWAAAPSNGSPITAYEVRWHVVPVPDDYVDWTTEAGTTNTTVMLTITDKKKAHVLAVRARNNEGVSAFVRSEPFVATAPAVPTLTLDPDYKSFTVTVKKPTSDGGSPITGYEAQWRRQYQQWDDITPAITPGNLEVVIGAGTATDDAMDNTLVNGVLYEVRVRAVNHAGNSAWVEQTVTPSTYAYHYHGDGERADCHKNNDHDFGAEVIGIECENPNIPPPPPTPTPGPTPTPVVITNTVTRTETRTVYRDRPSSAAASAPAAPAGPTIIGDSGYATTYLAVDGQSIELRIHPQAGGPASHTFAIGSFIRDADLGQTYQIVAGGKRRWIAPNSPLVYQVPWAQVNSMYTFASNVVAAIPLDESSPPQGFLVRGMNGRIVSYDAGMWRWVPNIPTFQALGYRWCDVNNADAGFFGRISEGSAHPPTSQPENPNYPVCG